MSCVIGRRVERVISATGRTCLHAHDAVLYSLCAVSSRVGRAALVVAGTVLSAGPLAAGEPTCVVAYDDDRLTVHAEGVPLTDVVQEISRQSGADIVGAVRKPRDVSQDVDRVPLVDALVRLLGEQNFTLRYGPEGKLRTIDLLGEPLALAAHDVRADAGNAGSPASARQGRHHGARSSRVTLPDGQVVVTVAGTATGGATSRRDEGSGSPDAPAGHNGPWFSARGLRRPGGGGGQQPDANPPSRDTRATARAARRATESVGRGTHLGNGG